MSATEIRELAQALGCRTQADLAARLGVTQPRVSQILSGTNPVKAGALMTLIRTLQASHLPKRAGSTSEVDEEARTVSAKEKIRKRR